MKQKLVKYEILIITLLKPKLSRVNEVRILIHKLTTKLWIMTLASTYVLCYYLLYGHNFREKIEVAKKLRKRSEVLSFSITRLGRL